VSFWRSPFGPAVRQRWRRRHRPRRNRGDAALAGRRCEPMTPDPLNVPTLSSFDPPVLSPSLHRKSIACIVGARPNFMKIAPIWEEVKVRPHFRGRLIHTGQHASSEMSDAFFRDLGLPQPDEHLGIAPGSQIAQAAAIMTALEVSFLQDRPDLVMVVGDVTSTLAAALVAAKMQIPVAHVEAGLRSFDRSMPEEMNRILTDAIAQYLFVTEPSGVRNLRAEGVPDERIFFVGNVMIDTLLRCRQRAGQSDVLDRLGVEPQSYALATLHRPSNVDDPGRLRKMAGILAAIAERLPVIFPVHPRTRGRMEADQLTSPGLLLQPPLGYIEFLRLMSDARLVLTDSGGIQEETTILNVPCLTLRENTERPVTVEFGTNRLVGTEPGHVLAAAWEVLAQPAQPARVPELWDGHASSRILDILDQSHRFSF
jgi:UDP-N-acetylglucosamine 2-epimerase (non-hydrolysing)